MDKTDRIVVTGVGLTTPVGRDSVSATAAIRAGISRFNTIPAFVTPSGALAAGGAAYGLTDGKRGTDRLLVLAIPALQEALHASQEFYHALDLKKSCLLLCVGSSKNFRGEDTTALLESVPTPGVGAVDILPGGHAVGIHALQKAVSLLAETETASCIVGGVDCLLDYPTLAALDKAARLKTDQRSAGFIPGEAAAFLVLERESRARRRGAPVIAQIVAPCLTQELAHISSGAPVFGHGLAQAISQALALGQVPIGGMICDLNGEYYRSKEWTLALPKIQPEVPPIELWHPVENIGDIGAASAIVFAVVAVISAKSSYFCGSNVLIWTSSDDGTRGSVIVRGAPQPPRPWESPTSFYVKAAPLIDVLEEFIGEAAFLYAARRQCCADPELSWESLDTREKRLDANLEGLVLGGMESAKLLKPKLTLDRDGDPGEAFAAAAVYPSLGLIEPMQWLTDALAGGVPHYGALVDGLVYSEQKGLDHWIGDYLGHNNPLVRAAGARVLATRRPDGFVARLESLLSDADPMVFLAAALGLPANTARLGSRLMELLGDERPGIVELAARLLLRAGNREVLPGLRKRIRHGSVDTNRRLVLLLGACGDVDDRKLIADTWAAQGEVLPECFAALGLLGAGQVIGHLISQLSDPSQPRAYLAAIEALRRISGKEWFPGFDIEEAQNGEIVRFQALWRNWHAETGTKLQSDIKYRLGLPESPAVLLADLRRKGNPNRDLTFLELQFRYGCPVDFQHDARYSIQVTQLKKIEDWTASTAARNLT